MKQMLKPGPCPTPWNPDDLYKKSVRYVQQMQGCDSNEWEYALWSSLALELLARATLANVNPALLAECDTRNWSSLYHALGFAPFEEKYSPKSIAISEVFKRLSVIIPGFNKELENFGITHTGRRNSELHSGELAFDGVKGSTWQPKFFETCQVLLKSLGLSLEDFVGKTDAAIAAKLIAAAADESAKAVKGEMDAHKKVWEAKEEKERSILSDQAAVWAKKQDGHRVSCPACSCNSLVSGEAVAAPIQKLSGDEITETQEFLPNRFECIACGLKVLGLSRLAVLGLSEKYKKTQVYDAAEYYAPADDYAGFEEDNNER